MYTEKGDPVMYNLVMQMVALRLQLLLCNINYICYREVMEFCQTHAGVIVVFGTLTLTVSMVLDPKACLKDCLYFGSS